MRNSRTTPNSAACGDWRTLRGEQREDWLAVGIFTMLLSGVDAFVSTHLQDFPEPLTVEGDPITGTVEVSVRLPVGRW